MPSPSKPAGPKTTAENTAKVARRRANAKAEADVQIPIPKEHANHRIPPIRELDIEMAPVTIEGHEATPIGMLLGGVSDFKILRGSVASLNVTTSTEFRHLLSDLSVISRGNLLILAAYEIPRVAVFGPVDEDAEDGDAGDE